MPPFRPQDNIPDPYKIDALDGLNLLKSLESEGAFNLQNREIAALGYLYSLNMARATGLVQFIPYLLALCTERHRFFGMANERVLGTWDPDAVDPESKKEVLKEIEKIQKEYKESFDKEELRKARWGMGLYILNEALQSKSSKPFHEAIEALLPSAVLLTWTAFETLAGDLWELVVNLHPSGLASLNEISSSKGDKQIPLSALEKHHFDVAGKMGTVLREARKVTFTSLRDIQESYERAFGRKAGTEKIQAAINSPALRHLSAIRNVIVHKAGKKDKEYNDNMHDVGFSMPEKDGAITISGEVLSHLIPRAVAQSLNLIQGVDEWLDRNPSA